MNKEEAELVLSEIIDTQGRDFPEELKNLQDRNSLLQLRQYLLVERISAPTRIAALKAINVLLEE